jgi:hypothetical protein
MHGLERFLTPDPRDDGCDETRRLMHVIAEAVLAGEDLERWMPAVAAHLRDCPPCSAELEGLLAAIRETTGSA